MFNVVLGVIDAWLGRRAFSPAVSRVVTSRHARPLGSAATLSLVLIPVGAFVVAGVVGLLCATAVLAAASAVLARVLTAGSVDLSALYVGSLDDGSLVDLPGFLFQVRGKVDVAKFHHEHMAVMLDSVLWDTALAARDFTAAAKSGSPGLAAACQSIVERTAALVALVDGPAGDVTGEPRPQLTPS